jgi:hypothetical protein
MPITSDMNKMKHATGAAPIRNKYPINRMALLTKLIVWCFIFLHYQNILPATTFPKLDTPLTIPHGYFITFLLHINHINVSPCRAV